MRSWWIAMPLLAGCAAPVAPAPRVVEAREMAIYPGPCRTTVDRGPRTPVVIDYAYDRAARLVREVERSGGQWMKREFHYDARARRSAVVVTRPGWQRRIAYVYDGRGLLVAKEHAAGPGDVVRRDERFYDREGRLVRRRTVALPAGAVSDEHRLLYDADGRLVRELLGPEAAPTQQVDVAVDAQGRVIGRTRVNPDGSVQSVERFEYGDGGRLHEEVISDAARVVERRRFEYDVDGNALARLTFDGAGRLLAHARHDYGCW